MSLLDSREDWNTRRFASRFLQYLILGIVVVIVFVPVVILIFGALKTRGEFMTRPYTLPIPPRWENITGILTKASYSFWPMLGNSLWVMVIVTLAVVLVCSLAAFVFARMEFRSKGWFFNLFTLGLMFPINVAILPVYFVLRQMHLIDSLWGVIVVQTAFQLSGNIMILRGFFASIPAAQGTLQALFEYQTAICRLTGLDVSNASLYDGGTACAEAAMMALRVTGRNRIVLDASVSPFSRQVLKTYLFNLDVEVVEIAPVNGALDRAGLASVLDETVAAVLVQNPNFFGTVDDFSALAEQVHALGGLLIASVYPVSLGILKSPGEMGVDIAVGDGQSLGNPLSFGGPSFGFIAARKSFIRNMPGRIVGETVDRNGKRGFVLTLQAREQHIKRHKATSNICSNQGLCALRGLIFLSLVGKQGLADLATLNRDKAEYAKARLTAIQGVTLLQSAPTFNEFTVSLPKPAAALVEGMLKEGIAAGVPLGDFYEGLENALVVTVTEKRSKKEIDHFVRLLEAALCN